jgi:ParB-like nuclease domain
MRRSQSDTFAIAADQHHQKRGELQRIPLARIAASEIKGVLDEALVASLAASMAELGLRQPITVGWNGDAYTLVTGAHRLAAAKELAWHEIDAFVASNEASAKLWETEENLVRRKLTVLERAECVSRWIEIHDAIGGQDVRQTGPGRPKGGKAEAARRLPVPGKNVEARRKEIERASKIAGLAPEVKHEARRFGLADNQSALLTIAQQATPEAQLVIAKQLSQRRRSSRGGQPADDAVPQPTESHPKVSELTHEQRAVFDRMTWAWERAPEFRSAVRDAPADERQLFWDRVVRNYSGKNLLLIPSKKQ